MAIPLPLTKKQLAEIVKCYAMVLPGWKLTKGLFFSRSHSPIVQYVGFEPLSAGEYRPWSGIGALPLHTVRMLHQFLDVRHRQLSLREHATRWKAVVAAMEQQFHPSIRKPLDLREVRDLCAQEVQESRESTNNLCMLAILSAYLSEKKQALSYCQRLQTVPYPLALGPRPEWEKQHQEFGRRLTEALEAGIERQFLDSRSGETISDKKF